MKKRTFIIREIFLREEKVCPVDISWSVYIEVGLSSTSYVQELHVYDGTQLVSPLWDSPAILPGT